MPSSTPDEPGAARAFAGACRLAFRLSPAQFLLVVILGVTGGAALAPAAVLTKHLINDLAAPDRAQHTAALVGIAMLAAALTAAATAVSYLAGIPAYRLAARVQLETESQLARACTRYPGTAQLDEARAQDRLALAQRGAHEAPQFVTTTVTQTLTTLARVGSFVGVLWATSPPMVLAMLVSVIPLALMQRRVSRRSIEYTHFSNSSYRWRDYFAQQFSTPATARDMRLYGAQDQLLGLLRGHLSDALDQDVRRSTRIALAQLGYAVFNAVIAGAGAAWVVWQIARGRLSVGDFLLFSTAVIAVQGAISAALYTAGEFATQAAVFASYQKVIGDAATAALGVGSQPAPPLTGCIEFADVWFRYPGTDRWALRGLTLQIPAGRLTAIVGLNGAGKSSVVNLVLGFYQPERGTIRWAGTDLRLLDPATVRARTCGVLQEHTSYELSALDNLTIGLPAGRHAAEQAAATAGVLEAIERLPRGLDTLLSPRRADEEGNNGISLSGGQWQRIALARAMLRSDRDLLVLDEANSKLDVAADHRLNRWLGELTGRTRLVVTHRLDGIRQADLIYLLSDGTVAAAGTHEELLATDDGYAQLVQQAAAELEPLA